MADSVLRDDLMGVLERGTPLPGSWSGLSVDDLRVAFEALGETLPAATPLGVPGQVGTVDGLLAEMAGSWAPSPVAIDGPPLLAGVEDPPDLDHHRLGDMSTWRPEGTDDVHIDDFGAGAVYEETDLVVDDVAEADLHEESYEHQPELEDIDPGAELVHDDIAPELHLPDLDDEPDDIDDPF